MEMWHYDGYSLAEQLRAKESDPISLLEHYRSRIESLNPTLNAVVCWNDAAHSDAAASKSRLERGQARSLLDGVPILVKDNLVVRDMPTTWGSELYKNWVSKHDEIPIERLRSAGAVIVGKTNVPEFTIEGYTDNNIFGLTPNPWDLNVTPGGSSGGSVAAVAAGMIPLSVGTDGGGSVRRPAAYTNLVGLKTSIGRIPRGGGLPQLLLDMEVIGPLTRTVRDQALLFDVLCGHDLRDHRSLQFPPPRGVAKLSEPLDKLRILAVERFGDAPLDPCISLSFKQMVNLVSMLGHRVTEDTLPLDIDYLNKHWTTIGDIGLGLLCQREPKMRELASPKYVKWADSAATGADLLKIIEIITDLRNQASQLFSEIDLIMTPTCAAMPWSTEIPFPESIDGQPVGPRGSAIYTGWVNAIGNPAVSVPSSMQGQTLPIGTQFVGPFGNDELLLQIASQIETVQNWTGEWPRCASEIASAPKSSCNNIFDE